jgi:arylsulfatase A-like enzyme
MSQNHATPKRPHILIFNPDQWRGDVLGHLGNPAAVTPTLDQLVAHEAVSFANAFCQNPVCTPSRCSFMTGWYPHVRGHRTMFHMLQPDEPVLLKRLKDAGYFVWWGGKNDLVPGQNGYAAYCDIKNPWPLPQDHPIAANLHSQQAWRGRREDDAFYSFYAGIIEKPAGFPPEENFVYDGDWHQVLSAVEFIRSYRGEQPLCIYLPLGYPHPPYGVEDPWYSLIDRSKVPPRLPTPADWRGKPSMLEGVYRRQRLQHLDEAFWNELRATYYGMCARVDHQLGLVLNALKARQLYDNTALFFFADHGDYTGDYGLVEKTQNTFEDCLTHVPFIIKPPAGAPVRPRASRALVELVDFPATVEALAGLPPTHTHFGRSLLPVIAGETDEHRNAVFCEGGRVHGEEQAMELMDEGQGEDWLYWPRVGLQHNEGPEHTKAVMCRTRQYKYVRRLYESDELYDLKSDPGEQHNRIEDPALTGVLAQLKERLLDFMLETGDVVPFKYDQRN